MSSGNASTGLTEQPNCNICGRFAKARRDDTGAVLGWFFPCVTWDSYTGAYEHE